MKIFMKSMYLRVLPTILMLTIGTAGLAFAENATLRMLIWEGYAPEELRTKFISMVKEEYGVDLKLEVSFVNANDDFFPALRDGKFDLISPSHPIPKDARWKMIDRKLVLPLNLENIPNYSNILPSLQKADYCTKDGKVYAVPHVRGPYGLAYNTNQVTDEPKSWNALWDPKFKGKYTLGQDAYVHNVSITALAMGFSRDDINNYKKVNTAEIQAKLATLATNSAPMWQGVDDAETLKGLSLAVVWGFSIPALADQGEVWKIAEPSEGTTGWVDNFMISYTLEDKPKLRKIAEAWLNYTLSDDYQRYTVRGLACAPVTANAAGLFTAEEAQQLHLSDPKHFENNRILWKILGKKDRNGLKRLWEKALKSK